jgi:hypothetical protein
MFLRADEAGILRTWRYGFFIVRLECDLRSFLGMFADAEIEFVPDANGSILSSSSRLKIRTFWLSGADQN